MNLATFFSIYLYIEEITSDGSQCVAGMIRRRFTHLIGVFIDISCIFDNETPPLKFRNGFMNVRLFGICSDASFCEYY